jgi:hypothetical protein
MTKQLTEAEVNMINFIDNIINNNLIEAKAIIFDTLTKIAKVKILENKEDIIDSMFVIDEAYKNNVNIIRQGKILKIKRRIRRNSKGKIVVQRNVRRSALKGYRIKGNSLQRIPATERLMKSRLLKRSWKTTRRAKLRRTLLKRKITMRRRLSMGLK